MKKAFLVFISLVFISIGNISFASESEMMMKMNLKNVTNGTEIRGITIPNDAAGYAAVKYNDEIFSLHAEFSNLTEPKGEDFYEGWLVQKSPFKFISTGKLDKEDGKYHNKFESEIDYSSYDFYVLTLEPNDGDTAPADHIFEGTVLMHDTKMMDSEDMNHMKKENMMDDDKMAMEKKAMMNSKAVIRDRILKRVPNLSKEKIMIILERVEKLRIKIEILNISDEKRKNYNDILDIFVEVLEGDEMMMEK